MTSRRGFFFGAGSILTLAACGRGPEPAETTTALEKAQALIAARPSLDLHAHPGRTFIRDVQNLNPGLKGFAAGGAFEDRAIADMKKGGVTAAVFSAVADLQILAPAKGGLGVGRDFESGEAYASYETQIGNLEKLFETPDTLKILTPGDIAKAKAEEKTGVMLGVEGGDFAEGSAERIAQAHAAGVRCINPVHYHTNEIGDAMTETPVHDGLTPAGADIISAMNRLGVIIDVAHASEKTAFAMIEKSDKPVLCSHTHIRTPSFDFPRFISLDLAQAIASSGGVIGAWPAGIGISTLEEFADRILALIYAVGADHVGLGSDMDGNYQPVWDNYDQFPALVALLIERGLSDEDIAKVIGGNGVRVFEAVSA